MNAASGQAGLGCARPGWALEALTRLALHSSPEPLCAGKASAETGKQNVPGLFINGTKPLCIGRGPQGPLDISQGASCSHLLTGMGVWG